MKLFDIYSRLPVFMQQALCNIKGYQLDKQRYGGGIKISFSSLSATRKPLLSR